MTRDNSFDRTIERNYLQKRRFLIKEYEEVKAGRSAVFATVGVFYRHHGTCSQTFRKYYNRYLAGGREEDLMPRKRGPKWKTRRLSPALAAEIAEARRLGLNRYEIYAVLSERRPDPPKGEAYLIGIVCSCTRLAWAEIVIGKKALPVMFRTLKALNVLNQRYGLVFGEMLTE